MIVGNIKDRRIYETAHPLFSQAFDFIKKHDIPVVWTDHLLFI